MSFQTLFNRTLSKNKFSFRQTFSNYEVPIQIKSRTMSKNRVHVLYLRNTIPHVQVENILCRTFHSKAPKHSWGLPTVVWLLLLPFLQIGTIIVGMNLRRWWANLPENKMDHILRQVKTNQQKIIIGLAFCNGIVYAFYKTHLVEDPITKRKKFLIFSDKQMRDMATTQWKFLMQQYKNKITTSGNHYKDVLQISQKILRANRHLPGTNRDWKVIIIDDKTLNAFVLPSGHIFVFTGLLKFVDNHHQLAAVVGHEIAHVLLSHAAENISKTVVLNLFMLLPLLALCTVFPGLQYYSLAITEYIGTILFHLPFSRRLELEADIVGLEMMSRACFDPQHAWSLWTKMEKAEKGKQVQWLSTHPSHKTRHEKMKLHMPKALDIFEYYCTNDDLYPQGRR